MATPLRRSFVVGLLVLACLTVVPAGPAAPASADTPSVTIPPDEVSDADVVTLTTSGFSSGIHGFIQCPTASIGSAVPGNLPTGCSIEYIGSGAVAPTFDMLIERELVFTDADGARVVVDCAAAPGACSVGVFLPGVSDGSAYAPLSFSPPIAPEPSRGLVDGATVAVTASGVPAGDWAVRQCTTAFVDPTDAAADASCGAPQPVTVDGGTASGPVTVHDPLAAIDGSQHACGATGCVLQLRSADGTWRGRSRISFGPPTIAVRQEVLAPEDAANVVLTNAPGTFADVRQCAGPVSTATCDTSTPVALDSIGGAELWGRPVAVRFSSASGDPLDCTVTPCSLVLVDDDGVAVAAAPLPFRPPPALTLDPQAGLLDGQQVAVRGAGLAPSTGYAVRQCLPAGGPTGEPWCDDSLEVVTSTPEGTFSVSVPVTTRMSGPALRPVHCRSQCALGVWTPEGWLLAPFAMAEGSVTVTPTDGLADGATVHIAGRDMQPTYTGIPIGPFPTGAASVGLCAAGTAESPNLFTALDGCSTASQLLPITEPDVEADLAVSRTFTSFTGRMVDCSASGACVVGVYRFEEDGSSTFAGSPVSFAP